MTGPRYPMTIGHSGVEIIVYYKCIHVFFQNDAKHVLYWVDFALSHAKDQHWGNVSIDEDQT